MLEGRFVALRILACLLLSVNALAQRARPSLSEPAISPDGHEIAFASGGDIWSVPAQGGEAHLLVSHPATESRPMYSPDGTRLAFISTRTGGGNIYLLTLATGDLLRLTYSDQIDQLDGWSHDGKWIYFTSGVNDIAGLGDIFRVSAAGGTPLEVSRERYLSEFEAAPSPNGQTIALVAKGISNRQWWRNGHAHIDETELWLKPVAEIGRYQRLLPADAKHAWPMWSADGRSLFYMSDASGAENIWSLPAGGAPSSTRQMTHFKTGRVLWPSIGNDGKTIVFERDFAIWRLDTASGKAEAVPIELRGLPASPGTTHVTETSFSRLALSPDGTKIAVIAHGEVFAASAKDGGEAQRITRTAAAESSPVWSPDSLTIAFLSERAGNRQIFTYDFTTSKETQLTEDSAEDTSPTWSPDGKSIAFIRDGKQLHVLALATAKTAKLDRTVTTGALERDAALAWSPDSQWVAFTIVDPRSFNNIHVVPAAGGEAHPITFLANGQTGSKIAWSPDGRYILFDTAQRSEQVQIARVDLLPHTPKYREDEFRELFRPSKAPGVTPPPAPGTPETPSTNPSPNSPTDPANPDHATPEHSETQTPAPLPGTPADAASAKAATPEKKKPEPVKIVFDGIRERLTLLPLGLSSEEPTISPNGKVLLFAARSGNQQSLYTYSLDELSKEPPFARQLTSTPGSRSDFSFSADSKEAIFLENGVAHSIAIESRTPKTIATTAPMDIDFDAEKNVVFEEAWSSLNRQFFDAKFNGQNWRGLHDQWAPYIAGTRTSDELRRDINLMIGELNASHSGINRPQSRGAATPSRIGNLGLRFNREAYESGRGLVVREVIALGPADVEGSIHPGDTLVSVNGEPITEHINLDALLQDQVGHRVVLGIRREGKTRDAVVLPISTSTAVGMLYRQWVNDRRAYVNKVSGGKLGYVHIADMSDGSLQQLYLDLDAQNESREGVIVDVRNNNGGYVNGYVLDVFTRRNYLMMTPRDLFAIPSRQSLGQRALGLPTILVTNESSLSDAEDFTEGYRSLGLGKVVGTPTAGWIIFTGGVQLIDGSALRTPSTRIQDLRGQTMEMHPRPVDVEVERPLGETLDGTDAQLLRAAKELTGSTKTKSDTPVHGGAS